MREKLLVTVRCIKNEYSNTIKLRYRRGKPKSEASGGNSRCIAESGQVYSGLISVELVDVWLQRLLKANQ